MEGICQARYESSIKTGRTALTKNIFDHGFDGSLSFSLILQTALSFHHPDGVSYCLNDHASGYGVQECLIFVVDFQLVVNVKVTAPCDCATYHIRGYTGV